MPESVKFADIPAYIADVPPEPVMDAASSGPVDTQVQRLLAAEATFLKAWRGRDEKDGDFMPTAGLAFSGGGVRSAAFALGVLQVLAGRSLLERFDYLSSVSGGGFVAGALIWFLGPKSKGRFGTCAKDFPFAAEPCSNAPSVLGAEIRANPRSDLSIQSNQSLALLDFLRQHGAYLTPGHGVTLMSSIAVVLRGILLNLLVWIPILVSVMLLLFVLSGLAGSKVVKGAGVPAMFDFMFWIAIGFGLIFLIGGLVYSFSTHPIWSGRKQRYLLHRVYETRTPWILGPLIGTALLATLPWAANASFGWIGQFGGMAFVALGIGIGLWSFLRPGNSWGVSFLRERALPLGALSALYGVLLFAYQSAQWLYVDSNQYSRVIGVFLFVTALLSGWFVNLNYISVQRFYRDRLMEAFMPELDRVLNQQGGPSAEADGQKLSDSLDLARTNGLYPLFNTHVPLASALNRRRRLRGGDNFILSPLFCGSSATGWRCTKEFMDDGVTLPTAMAISGSVNHQQSGLGEVGLALNPLVSLLKVLLNLRMGYWVPNPRADDQSRRPNHFYPGLSEALGVGHDEEAPFLLLEDGGYFDNLGLYELVRRRLRLILVCDAGADADARLSDLYRVLRLTEVDFGTSVSFDGQNEYLAVIPNEPAAFPEGGQLAERGYLIGHLEYADGSSGTLIYLKSALLPEMNFGELGFGSRRAGFPQESTMDQFFDEEQFDAHRRLGCVLAQRMIDETNLEQRLPRGAVDLRSHNTLNL